MNPKVQLERMDWENCRNTAKDIIRSAKMSYLNGTLMLKYAEKQLKKYPEVKK